ncbi:hypothetical protein [Variovorax sp. J22R115]|uniref:hypothetical protein n=1 Tax=Variovorax sp. J22R115 TaxID=3053509 RepID=UPI00257623DA|nr:hypothetical protein [Variovorax sp. J22R115]MDM0053986.1 hypothetical protein [Variovorax sp. J22R115]
MTDRRLLIGATYPILENWPHEFVSFANEAGIGQEQFSGANELHPSWMQAVIDEQLRRQKRGVGACDVKGAIEALSSRGRAVTQANVRSELGGSHATIINRMLGRRRLATQHEHAHLLDKLERAAGGLQKLPKRSGRTVARNTLIVLAAIHRNRSIVDVCGDEGRAVIEWVREVLNDRGILGRRRVRDLFQTSWASYRALSSTRCGDDRVDALVTLEVNRARTSSARSAQHHLSRAMDGLDRRLARSPASFHFHKLDGDCNEEHAECRTP